MTKSNMQHEKLSRLMFYFVSSTDDRTEEEQAEAGVPGSSSAQPSHHGPLRGRSTADTHHLQP